MPYFIRANARIHYEDMGIGEGIIATHGYSDTSGCWTDTGIAAKLAERYRFIAMDLRAHGRTVVQGQPQGFDVETQIEDIQGLADHLGFKKFHLLTHAIGGMLGARYAMKQSDRLLSLTLSGTSSATIAVYPEKFKNHLQTLVRTGFLSTIPLLFAKWKNFLLQSTEMPTVKQLLSEAMFGALKKNPGPYLYKMAERPNSEKLWDTYWSHYRQNDLMTLSAFRKSFCTDADAQIDKLREIHCPTLVLVGEFDDVFLESCGLMAREIPNARLVTIKGSGHMTGYEFPEETTKEITEFLASVSEKNPVCAV